MNSGQIIKVLLHERGIKLKWLAQQLNVSSSNLWSMLNRDLKVRELEEICKILNIKASEVLEKKERCMPDQEQNSVPHNEYD